PGRKPRQAWQTRPGARHARRTPSRHGRPNHSVVPGEASARPTRDDVPGTLISDRHSPHAAMLCWRRIAAMARRRKSKQSALALCLEVFRSHGVAAARAIDEVYVLARLQPPDKAGHHRLRRAVDA